MDTIRHHHPLDVLHISRIPLYLFLYIPYVYKQVYGSFGFEQHALVVFTAVQQEYTEKQQQQMSPSILYSVPDSGMLMPGLSPSRSLDLTRTHAHARAYLAGVKKGRINGRG